MCSIFFQLGCVALLVCSEFDPQEQPIGPDNLSALRELDSFADTEAYEINTRPDGKQIAFTRWEQPVQILDPTLTKVIREVGNENTIHFAFSSNPKTVAYSTNGDGVYIVHMESNMVDNEIHLDVGGDQASIAFRPDGEVIVTGCYNEGATIWDASSGERLKRLELGTTLGGLTPVFSPDGKILAVGNRNSTTRLFDAETGELLHILNETMSHEIAFDPKSERLAVAYVDGTIALWDVENGQRLHHVESNAAELYSVCWSPDGKLLATSGRDGDVAIWSPDGLEMLNSLEAPSWVISLSFTPDGSQLIGGAGDGMSGGWRDVRRWGIR